MIIDIHTHAFDDRIARAAISLLSERSGLVSTHNGTITGLLESSRNAGIDCSVVQPVATKPEQTIKINDWAVEVNRLYADKGILCFGTIHPDFEDWKAELRRIKDLGLKGIKLHPDYQNFFIDESRMEPIYKEAILLDLIIMFHSGIDIGLPQPVHCTPRRISNIIELFSGKKVIFSHMGAFEMYSNVEEFIAGQDVYIDTSMALMRMKSRQAMKILEKHGFSKVLFGTDAPWSDQKENVEFINDFAKEYGLSDEQLAAIMGGNAAELLNVGR